MKVEMIDKKAEEMTDEFKYAPISPQRCDEDEDIKNCDYWREIYIDFIILQIQDSINKLEYKFSKLEFTEGTGMEDPVELELFDFLEDIENNIWIELYDEKRNIESVIIKWWKNINKEEMHIWKLIKRNFKIELLTKRREILKITGIEEVNKYVSY